MKNIIIMMAALFVASAANAQQDKAKFTALDVFDLEYATDPQPSADGSEIIYVRRSNDIMTDRTRSNIWSVKSNGSENRPLLSGRDNYSSPRGHRTAAKSPTHRRSRAAIRFTFAGMIAAKRLYLVI